MITYVANINLLTMATKYLFVDNGSNWETIETVSKGFPQLDVVPSLA